MPLTKGEKEGILKGIQEDLAGAKSVIFADYQGLSVKELKELRGQLKERGVKFQVAKKTLIKLAAKEGGYGDIADDVLAGPVGAAFSMEDEVVAASLLHKFAKTHNNLKLRGALFGGRVLSVAETKELAMLPSKEELLGKFVYLVKYPIQGFHGVLHNTIAGFVRALNAISEKQQAA